MAKIKRVIVMEFCMVRPAAPATSAASLTCARSHGKKGSLRSCSLKKVTVAGMHPTHPVTSTASGCQRVSENTSPYTSHSKIPAAKNASS